MNELLVVFPKTSILTSKSVEQQRVIERSFNELKLNYLSKFKGKIWYVADDELAWAYIGSWDNAEYISLIPKQEVNFLSKYNERFGIMDKTSVVRYESAKVVDLQEHKVIKRPARVDFRTSDDWLASRANGIMNIAGQCLKAFASEMGRHVLIIEDNIQNNRLSMSKCNVHEGDGRLFVQVCMQPTLRVNAYMGGIYIDTQALEMILQSLGG